MLTPFSAEKHTLWIEPTGEVRRRLAQIIRQMSARFATPEFLPHITLLPGCTGPRSELMERAQSVAARLRPFTAHLDEIDFREEYYRCLFVHAGLSKPLLDAHAAACRDFRHLREPAFMPHLSLLYGTFPRSNKEGVKAEIGPRLDLQFKVRHLHLYRTHGGPRRWRKVASFPLG